MRDGLGDEEVLTRAPSEDEGEKRGVMPTAQALEIAADSGLDLVEVSPGTQPPVCKILDFGKYKYQQQKKKNEAKKKQKVVEIKLIFTNFLI